MIHSRCAWTKFYGLREDHNRTRLSSESTFFPVSSSFCAHFLPIGGVNVLFSGKKMLQNKPGIDDLVVLQAPGIEQCPALCFGGESIVHRSD